jgi:hypothetical protein
MNDVIDPPRAKPVRRRRNATDKPPMPSRLEPVAAKAMARLAEHHVSPGVAVEVEKVGPVSYDIASPHRNHLAWEAMVFDALGTRSDSTARAFLFMLSELCSQDYHRSETKGECGKWIPDELELNMILNIVAGVKPANEMEAAQAAQMVAVHLMQMRLSARALRSGMVVAADAVLAGKLARTFTMQIEALAKLKGKRRSSKQTIIVKQEKHVHNHQHVHLAGGSAGNPNQSHEGEGEQTTIQLEGRAALSGPQPAGEVMRLRGGERKTSVPVPRCKGGRAEG